VDFIDEIRKIVVEVKPKEHQVGKIYEEKIKALEEWCIVNGYT